MLGFKWVIRSWGILDHLTHVVSFESQLPSFKETSSWLLFPQSQPFSPSTIPSTCHWWKLMKQHWWQNLPNLQIGDYPMCMDLGCTSWDTVAKEIPPNHDNVVTKTTNYAWCVQIMEFTAFFVTETHPIVMLRLQRLHLHCDQTAITTRQMSHSLHNFVCDPTCFHYDFNWAKIFWPVNDVMMKIKNIF